MIEYSNYSEALWQRDAGYMRWRRFMRHDWTNPSRYLAYHLIADYLWGQEDRIDVAEIGFGDGHDFRWFFQPLHDAGKIRYTGYEIMLPFVHNARTEYSGHEQLFQQGGFLELKPDSYDLIYTRHTFEHIHPKLWRRCLVRMLRATKECCVITWWVPPGEEEIRNWTGKGWQNLWRRKDVEFIIEKLGFALEVWELETGDHVYRADRL